MFLGQQQKENPKKPGGRHSDKYVKRRNDLSYQIFGELYKLNYNI